MFLISNFEKEVWARVGSFCPSRSRAIRYPSFISSVPIVCKLSQEADVPAEQWKSFPMKARG